MRTSRTTFVLARCRSLYPRCTHRKSKPSGDASIPSKVAIISFDMVLGSWHPVDIDDPADIDLVNPEKVQATKILNTGLKFNAAVSLSPDGAIICGEKYCMACALKSSEARSGNWTIINWDPSDGNSLTRAKRAF